ALMETVARTRTAERQADFTARFAFLDSTRPIVLVTGHRRENFGAGFENICAALAEIVRDHAVQIVYPVHPNPNVREPVERLLGGLPFVHLIEPLDYEPFVQMMDRAHLI